LLPDPGRSRPNIATPLLTPSNDIERELVRIWTEVLALDNVGTADNFFDLGGHSLSASRIVSRVLKHFRLDLPMRRLFDAPTIQDKALVIGAHRGGTLDEERLAVLLKEIESLPEAEAERLVNAQKDPPR
jgi:acyl carrier protein